MFGWSSLLDNLNIAQGGGNIYYLTPELWLPEQACIILVPMVMGDGEGVMSARSTFLVSQVQISRLGLINCNKQNPLTKSPLVI